MQLVKTITSRGWPMHPASASCRLRFRLAPPARFTVAACVAWRPLGPHEARSDADAPLVIQLEYWVSVGDPPEFNATRPKLPDATWFVKTFASMTPSAPDRTLPGGSRLLTSPSTPLTRFGVF